VNVVYKWTTALTEKKEKVFCYRCGYDSGFRIDQMTVEF